MFKSLRQGIFFLAVSLCPLAGATEGGGGAYANGADSFMVAALPPPGNYLVSYNAYYRADEFANPSPVFDSFKVESYASVLRAIHVSDKKILGGNWAMLAFLPYVNVDLDMGFASQRRGGMGDIIVDPFAIGWHSGNWHWAVGMDIYLPTGRYDKDQLVNIGRNYVTLEPIFAFTYRNPAGYEFSMKTMFDYNFENTDTNYRSGKELHADFIAAKHWGPWAVGVGGYAYQQVTGDRGGAVFGDFKGRVYALGPQVSYTGPTGFNISGKFQHEFDARNKPEGDKLWITFSFAL
ncbi:transporter [Pseudomonas lalucatii]|nr:transporter [Pseudomonas lalucatii]